MNKALSLLTLCLIFLAVKITHAQSSASTLDVVSWNMEWFGYPSAGPSNDDLQEANAKKIMRYLNADLYGMVEVVDSTRFRRLVDSLGNNEYGFLFPLSAAIIPRARATAG